MKVVSCMVTNTKSNMNGLVVVLRRDSFESHASI